MKVIIISLHYLDQQLGGPNCSKALIKAISSIYEDCSLIYPEHNDHTSNIDFLGNSNLKLIPCYDYRSQIKKGIDVYRGILHRFARLVENHLKSSSYDIVFINTSFVASSGVIALAIKYSKKVVTIHHNVEKDYIKDNEPSILFRFPYEHYVIKAERDAIKKSHLNIVLTEADCARFKTEYPSKSDTFEVIGMFEYASNSEKRTSTEYGNKFVISGSLNAKQTETALIDFFDNYFPIFNKLFPEAELILTGRNPSNRLLSVCERYKNISVVKNPQDIFDIIIKGNYYIAPINTGSGLKLRIMDGLRLGLPVLAHEVSCRGYETIEKDGFIFRYNNAESFEIGLKKLQHNYKHTDVVKSFYSHFSFEAGRQRLQDILRKHNMLSFE